MRGTLLGGLFSFVYFIVELRVLEFKVGLFHESWDLFEFVVSVLWVMEENAVKNFSEMAVEVLGDVATDFLAKSKLGFDALERCLVDAHSLFK